MPGHRVVGFSDDIFMGIISIGGNCVENTWRDEPSDEGQTRGTPLQPRPYVPGERIALSWGGVGERDVDAAVTLEYAGSSKTWMQQGRASRGSSRVTQRTPHTTVHSPRQPLKGTELSKCTITRAHNGIHHRSATPAARKEAAGLVAPPSIVGDISLLPSTVSSAPCQVRAASSSPQIASSICSSCNPRLVVSLGVFLVYPSFIDPGTTGLDGTTRKHCKVGKLFSCPSE